MAKGRAFAVMARGCVVPRVLTRTDVADFRERLREVATRVFGEKAARV
jgi:hypothetical protein